MQFFELAASKGSSNIPVNEPKLAQAAMDAAAAAMRRPRPIHKFKNSDSQPVAEQYYNGRKLSSGESPGNLTLPLDTPREVVSGALPQPSLITALTNSNPLHLPSTPISTIPQAQNLELLSGKPPFMAFTPRFSAEISVPPLFTPNTAGRHLSAALGLPTPSAGNGLIARLPFSQHEKESEHTAIGTLLPPPHSTRPLSTPRRDSQLLRPETVQLPSKDQNSYAPKHGLTTPKGSSALSKGIVKDDETLHESTITSDGPVNSGDQRQELSERSGHRARPNLTVAIPNPNREDHASGTPSGLHSLSSPSSGNESFRGLMSARLPGMTPTGQATWGPWNHLVSGERDTIPVPLTPFLNYNLDGIGDGSNMGFGGGHHFSLPSPTNAGLIPLTPRMFGFDPLATSRAEGQSLLPSKRSFDYFCDQNNNQNHKRPS